jgi:DNA-binding transcriptional LysR family regulator
MREQLKLMRAGELDLGIFMYAEEYEDMAWTTLFPGEPVVAYLPCDHPLTAKDVLTPEDLADETQVMFPRDANPPLYDYWEGLFASAGFRFRSRYEWNMDEPSDLLLAVASGFGVAFGLQSVKLAPGGSEVTMRPTEPQLRTTDFVVVWREDAPSRLQERLAGIQQIAAELRASAD